jgi:ribonuclease G
MTRQNVTDGPREILTKKCPTCAGDGIVLSEASSAMEVERRLRVLAGGSRAQAFQVEVNPKTASLLVGPGASRLLEIEAATKKRFFLVPKEGVHLDHAAVLAEGKLETLRPETALEEGKQVEVKLVELGLHDGGAAVGKLDGTNVVVGGAAKLVGKKAKVRIERVLGGVAYAALVGSGAARPEPITFESEAEKPTRAPGRPKRTDAEAEVEGDVEGAAAELEVGEAAPEVEAAEEPEVQAETEVEFEAEDEPEDEAVAEAAEDGAEPAPAKKKTRRGSRGGRNRKRKPAGELAVEETETTGEETETTGEATETDAVAAEDGEEAVTPKAPRIHVPDLELDEKPSKRRAPQKRASAREPIEAEAEVDAEADVEPDAAVDAVAEDGAAEDGADVTAPVKKKTRRGSRGGRNRKKTPAAAGTAAVASENGAEPDAEGTEERNVERVEEPVAVATVEPPDTSSERPADEYVPMSEWLDEIDS